MVAGLLGLQLRVLGHAIDHVGVDPGTGADAELLPDGARRGGRGGLAWAASCRTAAAGRAAEPCRRELVAD